MAVKSLLRGSWGIQGDGRNSAGIKSSPEVTKKRKEVRVSDRRGTSAKREKNCKSEDEMAVKHLVERPGHKKKKLRNRRGSPRGRSPRGILRIKKKKEIG